MKGVGNQHDDLGPGWKLKPENQKDDNSFVDVVLDRRNTGKGRAECITCLVTSLY